ncbi:MAG: hypothetical protein KIC80_05620 [Brachyspira sp.]|mgnify:CR=1|nr:hypothetical protein [Brachyspira sp.]CCY25099.1 unknown [Brachyspira sp. CAG:484]
MDEKKERKLTVIERTETDVQAPEKQTASRQTNPIVKKLISFHMEKASKFSVKDLFKK